jgi:V/A-type H+-transporting ATPase subunit K
MEWIIPLPLVLVIVLPLFWIYRRKVRGLAVKNQLLVQICSFFALLGLGLVMGVGTSPVFAAASHTAAPGAASGLTIGDGLGLLAAALATALSGIGGGIAVASAASAAIGAVSENDKVFAKALLFAALAESIALFGFVISFQIITKIG